MSSYQRVRAYSPAANQAYTRTQALIVNRLSYLGIAYLKTGDPQEAIKTFERGTAMLKASGLKSEREGDLSFGLGQAYLAQKGYPRALEIFTKVLPMAEERRQTALIQQASSGIGDVLLQTKKEVDAIPYYKKAIESIESTRSLLESEEFRTSFFEDKGHIYSAMISAHLEAKNVEEAFNYNERARSRAFLDILGSKIQLTTQGALLDEERALQTRISLLKARIEAGVEVGDQSGGEQSEKELEAAQSAYNDFLAKVRKENREQASLMNVEPLTLKQVQEILELRVTMLEYFVTPEKVQLWLVEKNQIQFFSIPINRRDVVRNVTALREGISQADQKEQSKQQFEELYRLLVEPALPHVKGKELLIIPHDVLHYLPFQALLSEGGKYLIQEYAISYLSSASLMQFARQKKGPGRESALVLGNPSLGDEAYNLRFAEREAKEIAQIYPKSAVFVKDQATKARAISLSPQNDILHFAVHADFNEVDPVSTALLPAPEGQDDGRLKVGDIFALKLNADVVVLAACETGLGRISNGDEIIGMPRAFIYAGTPSVITTLWKVNDRASYELMREFYANLKTMKKSEALRQAQLKTMNEFPQPFFWAGYGLTGEP